MIYTLFIYFWERNKAVCWNDRTDYTMGGMCNTFGAWVVLYGCVFWNIQAVLYNCKWDSRRRHHKNKAKKRHLHKTKKERKVHSFLMFLHIQTHMQTRDRTSPWGTPHPSFSGQYDSCQDRQRAQVALWVKTRNHSWVLKQSEGKEVKPASGRGSFPVPKK